MWSFQVKFYKKTLKYEARVFPRESLNLFANKYPLKFASDTWEGFCIVVSVFDFESGGPRFDPKLVCTLQDTIFLDHALYNDLHTT